MRFSSTTAILAICLTLLAHGQRDALRQGIFPQLSAPIKTLPVEQQLSLIADLTETCLQDTTGQGAGTRTQTFCGCKIARLSTFLSAYEMSTGRFDRVPRYLDNRLQMQQAIDQCARHAMIAL